MSASIDLARRRFVTGSLAALSAATLSSCATRFAGVDASPRFSTDPFTLGVASGCPRSDGVVLWTRLAPDPLQGGGMDSVPVQVNWRVAEDQAFKRIVANGVVAAVPELAHSVHVEVGGLRSGRDYWYRFEAGDAVSPIGRTRTTPAVADQIARFRLAFASCQQYEQGYYTAYRDMANRELDLVVHLGDYIYESSWGARRVRHHIGAIPTTLPEYRDRYALYKSDPDLRAAHAAFPWLVIWDDHEVANDYANDVSPRTRDPKQFLAIRSAAYQAWYEHMPVPAGARPRGPDAIIHGRYRCGDLLDITLLDTRQYRAHHACLSGPTASMLNDCPERHLSSRSLLGDAQERWFAQQMRESTSHWSMIAQPTLMAEADRRGAPSDAYWMDGWDGYTASRTRLLDSLAMQRNRNALVIGGDVHAFWAADLRRDFAATKSPVLATEFTSGAITSQGLSAASIENLRARNPHLRYGSADRRGYGVITLEHERCNVEFRAVDDEKEPSSTARTLAKFEVVSGKPGVQTE
ncbi:MAG TPA: alkaline phosphatase D family protein [Casimicrobiaceae bacterium]|nr:alkaline phosphatase D family protein [Casimicrobiaceae bacterium]